ncbi:MAG: aldo/keto reductase [Deltaproteobacteria bacterium]|nr:aldo/keto reductase [Deltaproteobacteria bacterium]
MSIQAQLAFGAMNFGKRTQAPGAKGLVDRALDLGMAVFDTANVYNDGESERLLGKALGARRSAVQIASKVGMGRVDGKPEGLSRAAILRAVDGTLQRLGSDFVDLYYLHVPDHATPIEESIAAMGELVKAGKIRAWGVSNYAAWQILEMMHIADRTGVPRPVIAQQLYNVLIREIEVEYLPFAKKHALGTTVYNPLAGGLLAGRIAAGVAPPSGSRFAANKLYPGRYLTPRMFERTEALKAIAREAGLSLLDLSYAWLAARPGVDSILVGPGELSHLDAAAVGVAKKLSAETLLAIDALHARELGTDTHYVR